MKHAFLYSMLLALAACGGLPQSDSARFVIEYATLKLIDSRVDKAQYVLLKAQRVLQAIDSGEVTTPDAVRDRVLAEFDVASLDPADQLLANRIANRAAAYLQNVTDTAVAPAERLAEPIRWVISVVEGQTFPPPSEILSPSV